MKTKFIDKKINYDGSQLRSHWIFEETGIIGDAIVSFIGGCNVAMEHMVDMVDKNAGCKIYSKEMLHFIAEHFDCDMEKMILRQRLFVAILADILRASLPQADESRSEFGSRLRSNNNIVRKGNDIFDGDAKLNVSIATASPVSCLMHVGINVSSEKTPVKTKSLFDYGIDPKIFAEKMLLAYDLEIEGSKIARCKVRGVN